MKHKCSLDSPKRLALHFPSLFASTSHLVAFVGRNTKGRHVCFTNLYIKRLRATTHYRPMSSDTAGKASIDVVVKTDKASFENSTDFSNYFCTYGFLYHQKQMLEDTRRMDGYFNGVMKNKDCFKDKVVLDVGTGTGVLAMWAAQAGARKVYAVEATSMAKMARIMVEKNGLSDKVEVIEGKMEEIELPEKVKMLLGNKLFQFYFDCFCPFLRCQVDIIISEWMGYMLLRESMLDSVIYARDKSVICLCSLACSVCA